MNIKRLKIINIILAFVFCFPLHFLYSWFPSFVTSIFAPVNESIWEHMKILFSSIILSGVISKIIVVFKNLGYKNVCFSNFVAGVSSIPIFLVMYLPLYFILGHSLVLSISVMLISIIISEIISYKIMLKYDFGLENKTIFFVIGAYVLFTLITYFVIL